MIPRLHPLLLLLLLGLAGCLDEATDTVVQEDGSGTITLTATLDVTLRDGLLAGLAREVTGMAAPALAPDPRAPVWLEAAARGVEGFAWDEIEVAQQPGVRTTTARGRFDDLEAAARAGAFLGFDVWLRRDTEVEGGWRLGFVSAWRRLRRAQGERLAGRPLTSLRPLLEAHLGGLSLEHRLRFPWPVRSEEAEIGEAGRQAIVRLDGAALLAGRDAPIVLHLEPGSAAEDWVPFLHRADLDALARRLLSDPPPRTR